VRILTPAMSTPSTSSPQAQLVRSDWITSRFAGSPPRCEATNDSRLLAEPTRPAGPSAFRWWRRGLSGYVPRAVGLRTKLPVDHVRHTMSGHVAGQRLEDVRGERKE
jgi:hypothetical protein